MTSLVHLEDIHACAFSWPLGQDLDSHRGLHDRLRGHVCEDMEGPRHLQKRENEEEGNHPFCLRVSADFIERLFNKY